MQISTWRAAIHVGALGVLIGGCGPAARGTGGALSGGFTGDDAASTGPIDGTDDGHESGEDDGEATDGDEPWPPDSGSDSDGDDTEGADAGPIACAYTSTTFGQPLQHLDVMDPDSPVRLTFSVPGLPDPALIESVRLRFDSYDADHPGEEGYIYVGDGVFDIPADTDWEEQPSTGDIDITGHTVAGANLIEFGPGPLPRSYFFIGQVQLDVIAYIDTCDDAGDMDNDWDGVEQTIGYRDAEYTGRHNWVLRCDGPEYAFTAANGKHADKDCDGLYAPDGSAHGTATFHFEDVVEDDYLVQVHAYHTWNRNPNGALVWVEGVSGRVHQRSEAEGVSSFETVDWGIAHLSGDVDIVMDSAEGGYASDAVSWIRIVPQ
ncbi:MAG: hypothetical protein AAF799_19745 [Myxococcota bacterium]